MSCRSNYYKLIFERFDNSDHTAHDESKKYSHTQSGEEIEAKSAAEIQNIEITPSNKLEAKRSLKYHLNENVKSMSSFIKTLYPLKLNTIIDYTRIIHEFIEFSPQCKIQDYLEYLKFKTGYTGEESLDGFIVKESFIKHANIIRRFLSYLHHKEVPKVKIEYYKTPKRVDVNFYPKNTKEDIFKYYHTLLGNKKIEDAVLLHTMFSLCLDPYTLSLLTFESIQSNQTIVYWNYKTRSEVQLKLPADLYSELLYLKTWKKLKGKLNENEERRSMDDVYVVGSFIFSTNPTGIFNKFKRKFSGTLKDFNLTPKDMIILAKYYHRKNESGFHP